MANIWYYLRPDEGDAFYLFWAKEILISVFLVTAFYMLSLVVRIVMARVGARLGALGRGGLDEKLLDRVAAPVSLLINFAGLYLAIKRLPLPAKVSTIASGILFVASVIILANICYRLLDEMLERYGNRVAGGEMSRQLVPLVRKVCTIFLIGTALIIVLKHFNYDILSLVTALGVGSLAIGLAAKDTLANMISGFTLMLDRPFRIGDRIQLGTQVGDVVDIGLRSTKIKGGDNTYLIIPNAELCNSTLINQAFPDPRGKGRVNIGVAYGSDLERVKGLLTSCAAACPEVLPDPAPGSFCTGFGDNSINLALFFWVSHYDQLFPVTDRINCAIHKSLQDNQIVFPSQTKTVLLEKESISYGSPN